MAGSPCRRRRRSATTTNSGERGEKRGKEGPERGLSLFQKRQFPSFVVLFRAFRTPCLAAGRRMGAVRSAQYRTMLRRSWTRAGPCQSRRASRRRGDALLAPHNGGCRARPGVDLDPRDGRRAGCRAGRVREGFGGWIGARTENEHGTGVARGGSLGSNCAGKVGAKMSHFPSRSLVCLPLTPSPSHPNPFTAQTSRTTSPAPLHVPPRGRACGACGGV